MTFSYVVPVVVVTILNILLGMLWYSPLLVGPIWAKAYKFDLKKLKPTPWHYAGSVLVSLITVSILDFLIHRFEITTWREGMLLGFYLWLGLVATTHFSGVIWAKKPIRVYFIDLGYFFISIEMIGILLAVWQ